MSMQLHEDVLDFILAYRAKHPDFTCWLRQRNTRGKLDRGGWFQGNDNYAFVGLYKAPGGTNKTRSVGLVFWYDTDADKTLGTHFEVVYNNEDDPDLLSFYKELLDKFGPFEQEHNTKYKLGIKGGYGHTTFDAAEKFLDNVKPRIDALVHKNGLNKILISKEAFEQQLNRILRLRAELLKQNNMDNIKLDEFKRLFAAFKQTQSYTNRKEQYAIVPVLRDIITETLKNEPLENEHLTGMIQMFKYGVTGDTFDYYMEQNIQDAHRREQLSDLAYEIDQDGYTGAGLNSVGDLSAEQLSIIKKFLTQAFEVQTIEDAVALTTEFDSHNIPYVKSGVYSPWLHYIYPRIFPIKNTQHKNFIRWVGMPEDYPSVISPFISLMNLVGEEELGTLDMFAYTFNPDNTTSDHPLKTKDMHPLNTILYGPPGTGKTYSTIEKAIKIANPAFEFKGKERKDVKEEYQRLVGLGRIDFCTFHQSMSYEDFVEGIKPVLTHDGDDETTDEQDVTKSLRYKLEEGIFKRIVQRAQSKPEVQTKGFSIPDKDFEKEVFFKMSLGAADDPEDDVIFKYCMDNGYVALGWGGDIDYTGLSETDVIKTARKEGLIKAHSSSINYLMHYIKKGNYVIISKGNNAFRAIGRVTGEYEYLPDTPIRYNHFRKVEWILKDVDIPVEQIYDRAFMQWSIYKLDKNGIKKDFFVKSSTQSQSATKDSPGNYVLVIDEINRGNVSQIFGELITLIEDDKREGKTEELSVILPYSKKRFTVPSNLHIIGTMNTADKSVEALDAALRRRFRFEFNGPDYSTLLNKDGTEKTISDIPIKQLLETINQRITYLLDEDHQIGHSYFMKVNAPLELRECFEKAIIPLLKEYFYNDNEKILWILGKGFVTQTDTAPGFASGIKEDLSKQSYDFIQIDDDVVFIDAIKQLLNLNE